MEYNTQYEFDDDLVLDDVIRTQVSENVKSSKSNNKSDVDLGIQPKDKKSKAESNEDVDDKDFLDAFVDGVSKGGAPDDVTKWYLNNNQTDDEEDEGDSEELESKETKKQVETKDQQESFDDDEDETYPSDLLDIIRQEGLLYIPDDFEGDLTEDALENFKEQTREMMKQEVIDSVREAYASDPYKLQLFDYFIFGESHVNVPVYQSILNNIKTLENLDLKNDDVKKSLLRSFLSDGLNQDNPSHRIMLGKVDAEIDQILASYDVDNRLSEAKTYFLNKNLVEKQKEEGRIVLEKQKEQQEQMAEQARMEKWHDDFYKTLQINKWSMDKKKAIYREQYEEVQFQDGSTAPVWYAKETMIKSNPELYQVYLDWLNTNFDLTTGKFKNNKQGDTDDSKVTRKILELAQKKNGGKKKSFESQNQNRRGKGPSEGVYVNPMDNI